MIQYEGTFFPDGEEHLIEWCKAAKQYRDGVLCYQLNKYEAARWHLPANRRRVAIDVGAHIGQWSRVMAMDFEKVDAFEPVSLYRECFRANVTAENVELHACALGNQYGAVEMVNRTPGSHGDTQIKIATDDIEACGMSAMTVLDSFNFDRVDFIKLDCEGYELEVLRGAEATILENRPVLIVEQKPGHGEHFGYGDLAGVRFLEDLGAVVRQELAGDYILSWD